MSQKFRQNVLPIIAAFIWGMSFAAQSASTDHVGPFAFNSIRSLIAAAVLFIVIMIVRAIRPKDNTFSFKTAFRSSTKTMLLGSICCGSILFIASNLQQIGIADTTAGKASFITALYVVLVPLLGLALKKTVPINAWIGVGIAVIGLYFLCINSEFTIETGDIFMLLCALAYAFQILIIDHFSLKINALQLSCMQFFVAGILSGIVSILTEDIALMQFEKCILPLLYVGVLSSGVGFTLQIIAQKGSNPTIVTLLMSLESVFGVLAGAIFLNEVMSIREYIGCLLMFAAIVLAQLPQLTKIKP